ncbi:Hypothetical predicted protein [Cloeon dipterum]|uniref:RING-type domain-containing protein n=2 Tax=Cloeon dipterum TaxID=197152 RepID=A0A8S1DLS9_9INSE|nr:Hypothetical predicted protein [Cloeon dipterum]
MEIESDCEEKSVHSDQLSEKTRVGERMISMSSTLVETVSINYEDFNESFLTCSTCLCVYDGSAHTPKLLPCSHTVCLECLSHIASSQTRDTGSFRCPICRELITIPRGGVAALPPSFLVNQLLDLMSRQRREVIPKCSVHINQELLFCETCDTVFCSLCTGGSHSTGGSSCEHTIIPFSIAIKRMSEILLYKANDCISKLGQAHDAVSDELKRLDEATEACLSQVSRTFEEITALAEKRRLALSNAVKEARDKKKQVLEEQLKLIAAEKAKVDGECDGLQYQVEVRNITQKISSLTEKLDSVATLAEPRENSFLTCDFQSGQSGAVEVVKKALDTFGKVRTSTTFPSLCSAEVDTVASSGDVVAKLKCSATLSTVDYHGKARTSGGDPVSAELRTSSGQLLETEIQDLDDGTYKVWFRPPAAGTYTLNLSVFQRPIKDKNINFEVTEHNSPRGEHGCRGSGKGEFLQPVSVTVNSEAGFVYVLDTGNSRIKVLSLDLEFIRHIENDGLKGRSCTGIALTRQGLIVVNWRTKSVTEIDPETGDTISSFSHNAFQEPVDIAVMPKSGKILVADNSASCVFVFDGQGRPLLQVGKKGSQRGQFNLISSVAASPNDDILVADSRIQIFSSEGDFKREIFAEGKGRGRYGGLTMDSENRIIATRSEKCRHYIQVLSSEEDKVLSTVDSHDSKLKRPSGVAVMPEHHIVVVDLGNDCVKKYQYW